MDTIRHSPRDAMMAAMAAATLMLDAACPEGGGGTDGSGNQDASVPEKANAENLVEQ